MIRAPQTQEDLVQLLQQVDEREKVARRRAVLYSLVPIAVAAVLMTATGWRVYKAESRVARAKAQLDTLQGALGRLNVQEPREGKVPFDTGKGQEPQQQSPQIAVLRQLLHASAHPLSVATADERPIYRFRLWIEGSNEMLDRIAAVKYEFNHPTFPPSIRVQESTDRLRQFAAEYSGWGCLRSVIVTFTLVNRAQAPPPPVDFDMCAALSW